MHRYLAGAKKGEIVDHKNRDSLDNRRKNLRLCRRQQNVHNSEASRGSSKYRGVSYCAARSSWLAQIGFKGQYYFIGRFKTEQAAKLAYDTKRRKLAKEFAPESVLQ